MGLSPKPVQSVQLFKVKFSINVGFEGQFTVSDRQVWYIGVVLQQEKQSCHHQEAQAEFQEIEAYPKNIRKGTKHGCIVLQQCGGSNSTWESSSGDLERCLVKYIELWEVQGLQRVDRIKQQFLGHLDEPAKRKIRRWPFRKLEFTNG